MISIAYFDVASKNSYKIEAFDYIAYFKKDISEIANILGVSSTAIAGALAEERDGYGSLGPVDFILDIYAQYRATKCS